ncbi:MAG: T9SS type A sorting domain-containing protein [Bacteroidota bacterium]|nr:T9SS type A sorting domain-containing protein [Bacteroidota bacterium]
MKRRFTPYKKIIPGAVMCFLAFSANSFNNQLFAQATCQGGSTLFMETFGTGTSPSSNADVTSALTYQATGVLFNDGTYRVINNTQQKPEWQNSADHTGDTNGDMLVVNGLAETFYSHTITTTGVFPPGTYSAGIYIMNIDVLGVCAPNPLLPNISISMEYQDQNGNWQQFTGSPYVAAPTQQTAATSPTWVPEGGSFTLPSTGAFHVTNIKILISDGTVGGCGNDFSVDDIQVALCAQGGPTPVEFLGITANQSGNGIKIDWSTAQEFNSSSFEVQKSADGNGGWTSIATVAAAGNSSTLRHYEAYDPAPFNGANFYRLKQIDIDGNYTYSKTVMVSVSANQTSITVLANPFHDNLTLSFSSAANQQVYARLFDMTGQQVAIEKWSVSAGTSSQGFSNVNGLQPGMYILHVSGQDGQTLLNSKVIKQ